MSTSAAKNVKDFHDNEESEEEAESSHEPLQDIVAELENNENEQHIGGNIKIFFASSNKLSDINRERISHVQTIMVAKSIRD